MREYDYENMSFEELNILIKEKRENTGEELFGAAVAKSVEFMEAVIANLSRKYYISLEESDTGEIINDTLDNVMKYFNIGHEKADMKAYIATTVNGKFLNYFRDNIKGIKTDSYNAEMNEEGDTFLDMMADNTIPSSDEMDEYIALKTAFSKLGEDCQKSLYMRKVLDYSVDEIKKAMKWITLSEENVRKKISNCLKYLKQLFL